MKKLIIAEKPSVARDIAKVLGCKKREDGYLYNDEYIISWAIGHLVTLCEPEEYDEKFKKWNMATLPIVPSEIKTKVIKKTEPQFKILKKLLNDKSVESIICATDSGREGELIFRYIYELAKCKKPFERLWISSMTEQAIKEGFENLRPGSDYDNLYYSAKCRSEADWLVGINASRAYTIKHNVLLSIGRVQTPTLSIMVKRQEEIDNFEVKEYKEVLADFGEYKGLWFEYEKVENKKVENSKIFDEKRAEEIKEKIIKKEAFVKSVECENKKVRPPLLYDLTELQRDCNKKYGFSAQKTLSVAQSLYEKRKLITYPRTDSRYLSNDMVSKIKGVLFKVQGVDIYRKYAKYILGLEKLPITKRIVDNSKISDHHAIIPTDSNIKIEGLSEIEFKVYDLIVRRFLQVFLPDYIFDSTKIITECENELFLTKGTTIIHKGWTILNVGGEKEKKTEEILPNVKVDDKFNVKKVKIENKKTKPPANYNEATLLSAMENAGRFVDDEEMKEQLKESGLGTPATRASIIERLIKVGYIKRSGKSLIPTEKGKKIMDILPEEMKSPETTGRWEKGLGSIARGKMTRERFMGGIERYVNYIIESAKEEEKVIDFGEERGKRKFKNKKEVLGKCKSCGGDILENSKAYFCSNWQNNCKFTIWKNALKSYGIEINKENIKGLFSNEKGIEIVNQNGVFKIRLKDSLGQLEIEKIK